MPERPVSLEEFLDNVQFGSFHFRVVLVGALAMLVDGYDLGVLSWVLPKLSDDFGVTRTSLTWVLSMQQAGMVLGAYVVAPVADQIGRRRLLILCLTAVSVCCFITIFTDSVLALAICRLLTGVFASAVIANMVALTSELAPARHRATVVTMVLAGAMPGALLGSAMQAFLLEPYGWHSAFWIGSALPIILVPLMFFFLPESPRFMARNPEDARLRRLIAALSANDEPVEIAAPIARAPSWNSGALVLELFRGGLALPTILLWLSFVCSFGFISAALWKTTMFHDVIGLNWSEVGVTTALGVGCGALGMITIGVIIDRFGFRRTVPSYFFIAGLAAVGMGVYAPSWGMFIALAVNAITQHAAHAGLASIASTLYPSRNRATGVGWAYGAGRIASILGPLYGALALKHHWGAIGYFFLLAAPLISAGILVYILLRTARIDLGTRGSAH